MSQPPTIDRKTLKQPDAFVREGMSIFDWFLHHRRIWLPVIVGGFVVALGIYGMEHYQQNRLAEGWLDYFNAMKKPEAEQVAALQGVAEKWKKIRPGYFATVTLGDRAFEESRKEILKDGTKPAPGAAKAAEYFGHALAFSDLLPSERQLLYLNRGQAKEMEGKWDEAQADFQKASEFAGEAKPLAFLALARVEENKGQAAKATALYEKVAADFPNTEFSKNAKLQVRRLKSPLFASDKVAPKKG